MILTIIISKLYEKKKLSLNNLFIGSIDSQIILNYLIKSFTLIINLQIISYRKLVFNHFNLIYFLLKIRDNSEVLICNNTSQKVKIVFYILKKKFYKICSYNIILYKNK